MSRKNKDRLEELEDEIKKLKRVIRDKEKIIKQLKSEADTVGGAWKKTERFLKNTTNGRPLSELVNLAKEDKPLPKEGEESCPKCGELGLEKFVFKKFHITACDCGYRKKVDEERQIKKI